MRVIWLLFAALLAGLGLAYWRTRSPAGPAGAASCAPARLAAVAPLVAVAPLPPHRLAPAARAQLAIGLAPPRQLTPTAPAPPPPALADSLVHFALGQLGTNYCYAGTTPATGFDCSGFVQYVFGHFHIEVPHATALLITAGRPVPRAQARPGDIVVFTGTAAGSTTPGHAGIVISPAGQTPLRFVHSSSAKREPGVKISQVEGSGYERRFLGVRRVLQ